MRERLALLAVVAAIVVLSPETSHAQTQAPPKGKDKSPNALQVIEGVRGGRHWVDEATLPPKSPADSLAALRVEPGIRVELVAAEPLVMDPVAIAFDARGDMFVVEYGDYPIGPEKGGDPLSRVVYLEDVDRDGKPDRRHVFADKLTFAHSLLPFRDGLIVGAQTQVLYLKDTDGDHRADVREVLYEGFKPAHPQMQIGNPRWGMDNWIHLNYGPGTITSPRLPDQKPIASPRKDVRFDPQTYEFAADSGLGQFGNTIDRWGNRFYATNRNPIITTLLGPEVLTRNPYFVIPRGYYDVGNAGGDTRVYPLVKMKSNYLSHAGTHTSACGVTAYCGDALGEAYENSVFVCEPIGHLVTHSKVLPAGPILKAERARERADFVASTDTWFRPASLANGPDGNLYLADMYRLWVEHPKFLPPEIAEKLDWRAGEDRGRIYRFVRDEATDAALPPFTPPKSTADAASLLSSSNGWRQYLGQRLLIEQAADVSPEVITQIRNTLFEDKLATARLHALWTLDGLKVLELNDVQAAIADKHPRVRRDGVRLASKFRKDSADVLQLLAQTVSDSDASVRLETVLTAGWLDEPAATKIIADLAYPDGVDSWFGAGLMTAVEKRAGAVVSSLVQDPNFIASPNAASMRLLNDLGVVVGARGELNELRSTLELVNREAPGEWWRSAVLSGLGKGLLRHQGNLGRTSLAKLLATPPAALNDVAETTRLRLERNRELVLDSSKKLADRLAAIELLRFLPFNESSPVFAELLTSAQPSVIQTAVVSVASEAGTPANEIFLTQWSELGPAARGDALAVLLRRGDSTKLALTAMKEGKVQKSGLDVDQRVRLLKHADLEIRKLAEELLGGAVSSNRRKVAEDYQAGLSLDASSRRGLEIFQKICAKCHRIDGKGHALGPDLSDVRNRSKLALLFDIMDPNSKVEPRFAAYSIRTVDGEVFNGLVIAETDEAVVLGMGESKQRTISRADIEQLRASDLSLMPEGIEKEVNIQQMADLLEYLKTRQVTAVATEGEE